METHWCEQQTLFSCPINRFSYKVNLPNGDTLLSAVCCNKPFPFWRWKTFKWRQVDFSNAKGTTMLKDELTEDVNFRLFWHQTNYVENGFWLCNGKWATFETLECFHWHSLWNNGFMKVRDVLCDHTIVLFYFFSIFIQVKGVFFTLITWPS